MRSSIAQSESCNWSIQPTALAAIYYDDANTDSKPNSTSPPSLAENSTCSNDPIEQTVPAFPIPADENPSTTLDFEFSVTVNSTGHPVWMVNDSGFHGDYNQPVLELAAEGRATPQNLEPDWNVYDAGNGTTARVIMHNNSTISHVSSPPPPTSSPPTNIHSSIC